MNRRLTHYILWLSGAIACAGLGVWLGLRVGG